jgi:hypothetical protein
MAKSRRALAPLGLPAGGLTVTWKSESRAPAGTTAMVVTSHHQQGLPSERGDRFAVPALGYEGRGGPSLCEREQLKGAWNVPVPCLSVSEDRHRGQP